MVNTKSGHGSLSCPTVWAGGPEVEIEMDTSRHASAEFTLRWTSADARHAERHYADRINLWRDFFPGDLGERLGRAAPGETVECRFGPGAVVPGQDGGQVVSVAESQIRHRLASGPITDPRQGRFYPRSLLSGLGGHFPQDRRPLRYLGGAGGRAEVDMNHPLARYPLTVEGALVAELATTEEHGGRCNDLGEDLTAGGPGLQAAYPGLETDFFSGEPFAREEPRADAAFYAQPRLVNHIDATAMAQVRAIYGRLLAPGMKVLDLMSSWNSHLPSGWEGLVVSGLGMNAAELEHNERLTDRVVHDLNRDPILPFADAEFDAAICTVSVEYLTRPLEVFREVARVLKPGAPFAVTFSDRWFPPKVVHLWTELHPFERVGLVLEYFRRARAYDGLHTETFRGWPRPADDKYAHMMVHADPVYAVWAFRGPASATGLPG